jgi:hypothetical protein
MANPAPEQDRFLNRLRIPAVLLLAFMLMVGAYYTLHYQENAEYLKSRNFRLLATLGTQVMEKVKNEGLVFGNLGRNSELYESLSPRIYSSACSPQVEPAASGQAVNQGRLWRSLSSSEGAYRLSFHWQPDGNPHNPHGDSCGEVKLQDLLDPLFSSRQAFNAVLLANEDGKVIYLHGPKSLRVERLDLLIQNQRGAKDEHGAKDERGVKDEHGAAALQGYSGSSRVDLGGRFYTAFVQPVSLLLPFAETGTATKKGDETSPGVWFLAGLVAEDEFATKSLALSPSAVALLLGILLLAALAWPLAKLKMLGERQRVKKIDVLLVGLCSLLGVSVGTMFFLDVGAYRTLKSSSELQLQSFAEQMEINLLVELHRAYAQLTELDRPGLDGVPQDREPHSLPSGYKATYPHFESFARIDGTGMQVSRLTPPGKSKSPMISVADRLYFQQIHQRRFLILPEPVEKIARYGRKKFFLESVQSWTNGEWQAVISKPAALWPQPPASSTQPPAEVAALAIRMFSVIDPVLPPGFEFAVVGDDGTVLFHSDSARNLAEDFFEETDHNHRFSSTVSARHDEALDLRYWGESYRAFAIPVKGLPWTIVAMRNQQVLERINLDWLVTTLILVLIYTGVIAGILTVIAMLWPGYRAGWVWPDSKREDDFAKLVAIFAIFLLAFLTALFDLRGTGFLFYVAILLPPLSLVAAYLKLNQDGKRTAGKRTMAGCGALLLALLGLALGAAPSEGDAGSWARWVKWAVLALAGLACLLAADGPRWWRELPAGKRLPVSRSYPTLGLLLVLLAAVLPTAGFFKIAHWLQVSSFVRNGQLEMAKSLHERVSLSNGKTYTGPASLTVTRGLIDEKTASLDLRTMPSLDFYGAPFFNTTLRDPRESCKHEPEELEPLAALLPPYSEFTAQSRELLHTRTPDDDWAWCEVEGKTLFDGKNYLGVNLASEIEPVWRGNGPLLAMAGLLPQSEVTDIAAKIDRTPEIPGKQAGRVSPAQVLSAFLALSLFGTLLYALVAFVARRIFLLDIQEPLWVRNGVLPAMAGTNVLVISRTRDWQIGDRERFFCLSFQNLDEGENGWPARRSELVRDPDRNVLLEDFEHRAFDPAWSSRKLAILEELIFVHQRAVVVLSELSPAVLFSPALQPADPVENRWQQLLASFTQINKDVWPQSPQGGGAVGSRPSLLRQIVEAIRRGRPARRLAPRKPEEGLRSRLLREECSEDPFLSRIGRDLDPFAAGAARELILDELGERAQSYYATIWANCSPDERVVLGHLAEEGLINAKNRRVVRRLMARGLIQRAPNLRLRNETFRRFVTSATCREQVLSLEQDAGRSAWDRFHWPFSVGLAACAALILVTQRELLDSTIAAVTGVTAGLPTLLKLFDLVGWKRGVKSA